MWFTFDGITHSQVLSDSVSKVLKLELGPRAGETAKFADMFNKLFDCVNVSSLSAGKLTRNPFQSPYRSAIDFRS